MRVCLFAGALVGAFAVGCGTSLAVPVDVELQLIVDNSTSVSASEFQLQRDGYVAAFQSQAVKDAILGGPIGAVAVQFIFFASTPSIAVPWTVIDSAADADAFATAIGALTQPAGGSTGIGEAINFATPLFASNGHDGTRQVIDISSDGKQNTRTGNISDFNATANLSFLQDARDNAIQAGVDQINAIVIGTNGTPSTTDFLQADLEAYFTANVIAGLDPFVLGVTGFTSFEPQIQAKLTSEITSSNVPLPGSVLMLLGALGGLGVIGRRGQAAARQSA